ncbi:MAG: phosphoglycolate phosphatase-like HAD superfamily hydrolase [Myxococcota bacterium]|jgi:phosphoglycolate phosphatase-like HAD superfamily hydrolase
MATAHTNFIAIDWNGTVVPFFGLPAFAGVAEAISSIRAQQIPVIVVSRASKAEITADVERVGIEFDAVFGCNSKLPVLSDLRVQYGRGLYIGDLPSDMRDAVGADLDFIHADVDKNSLPIPGANNVIKSFGELEAVLLAMFGGER